MQDQLALLRRRWMGYVLQTGGLLPFLSVRANIAVSRHLLDMENADDIDELAQELDIEDRLSLQPAQLSVGQRQRVAIARALSHRPAVVIADEPTAALDPRNADRVMELFVEQVERRGATLIVASHDMDRVERFGLRCLEHSIEEVEDGHIRAVFRG
jgi:putative ABC transport system ATP-binding protein